MPSRSELPGNLNRKRLIKALQRLDFTISTKGGKGSHFKATYNQNQKSITIPSKLNQAALYYVLKEIEKQTRITWEQINHYS